MPFPQQTPRVFTRTNIENITPGQIGVYGLFKNDTCVYIGKGDIRDRLLAHYNGDNPCITKAQPTHYVDGVTKDDPSELEKSLILECRPICNKRVG